MSARELVRAVRARFRRALVRHPRLFVRCFEPGDRELGQLGEEVAALYLARVGFVLVGRRVRTPAGEVDILARENGRLVCVEVKTARGEPVPRPRGSPAIRDARWRPGSRLAAHRIVRHARVGRVDLIEVVLERRRFRLEHHKDLRRPLA